MPTLEHVDQLPHIDIESAFHLKRNKAPGVDLVTIDLLLEHQELLKPYLKDIFQRVLLTGFPPPMWCQSRIILISKNEK